MRMIRAACVRRVRSCRRCPRSRRCADQRLAEVGRVPRGLQLVDPRQRYGLAGAGLLRGRLAEAQHAVGWSGRRPARPAHRWAHVGDGPPRHLAGLRPEVAAPEARAGIDQDGGASLRVLAQVPVGLLAEEGRANANAEQAEHRRAEQQQQDVVEPAPAREPGRRRGEEEQRAERHLAARCASDQVEDDRRGDRKDAQQVERRQGAHAGPPRRLAATSAGTASASHPRPQQVEEHELQRTVGGDPFELDPQVDASRPTLAAWASNRRRYSAPRLVGIDVDLAARFHVDEHGRRVEGEVDLGRVEDPQHDDVVPLRSQVAQSGLQHRGIGASRSEMQHDQPALAHGRGELLERARPGRWLVPATARARGRAMSRRRWPGRWRAGRYSRSGPSKVTRPTASRWATRK